MCILRWISSFFTDLMWKSTSHIFCQRDLVSITHENLATLCGIKIVCSHNPNKFIPQYIIAPMMLLFVRHTTIVIFSQSFPRSHCGQQSCLNFVTPRPTSSWKTCWWGHQHKENLHVNGIASGNFFFQNADAHILLLKGFGINTFMQHIVHTYPICRQNTIVVQ